MLATATITPFEPAEPGIHPTAARIRDIILAKASDGEPAFDSDFDGIDPEALKTHFPAARRAADRIVVRQLNDDRGFETRAQLLIRASALMLRNMPTEIELHATLRANGLATSEIADLWPELLELSTDAFKRSRKLPAGMGAH